MSGARPNIIFIITDQQRYDTIHALGYSHMDTPHLDRLVHEGVVFTNCHITGVSCAPSRASLFTGNYPHATGVLKNADTWPSTWIESLAEAGYRCVNIGKMHTWPFDARVGFHERYVVENKDRYLAARYYFDEWDKALRGQKAGAFPCPPQLAHPQQLAASRASAADQQETAGLRAHDRRKGAPGVFHLLPLRGFVFGSIFESIFA
jgi:arylsulfatase A-like enzyme